MSHKPTTTPQTGLRLVRWAMVVGTGCILCGVGGLGLHMYQQINRKQTALDAWTGATWQISVLWSDSRHLVGLAQADEYHTVNTKPGAFDRAMLLFADPIGISSQLELTPERISALYSLESLRELSIHSRNDHELRQLSGLTQLESLDVRRSQISEQTLKELQESMPETTILYDGANLYHGP